MNSDNKENIIHKVSEKYKDFMEGINEKKLVGGIIDENDDVTNCRGTRNIVINPYTLGPPDRIPNPDYLFTEEHIVGVPQQPFTAPPIDSMKKMMKTINMFESIPLEERIYPMSPKATVENLIISKNDIIGEGEKLMRWLKQQFSGKNNKVVSGLNLYIYNGYVYITRQGISTIDVIHPKLVPGLELLKAHYGHPINYIELKDLVVRNDAQQVGKINTTLMREATNILEQEYLVALQPEPAYLTWCLKRLIMAWYGDPDLQFSIRQIKVLINQYRAKSSEQYNQTNGVLPSIVVYPKYGKKYARIVITKLSYLFSTYTQTGWLCSQPTFFIKMNDLLYYTNGLLDIKLYFKLVKEASNNTITSKPFTSGYETITGVDDPVYHRVDLQ